MKKITAALERMMMHIWDGTEEIFEGKAPTSIKPEDIRLAISFGVISSIGITLFIRMMCLATVYASRVF
jgi:hypothetical protein